MSLSVRRAWIEISVARYTPTPKPVALRKESVDRNTIIAQASSKVIRSLSARRAWIEIISYYREDTLSIVALRKESVDRNPV